MEANFRDADAQAKAFMDALASLTPAERAARTLRLRQVAETLAADGRKLTDEEAIGSMRRALAIAQGAKAGT